MHFLAKKISSLDGQSAQVVLCLNSKKYFSEAYWNIFKRWWLRASQWVFAVTSICNCHAGRYYKIHEMVGFYTFKVENKCSNWHSGATAPPPLQGPNLVEPADVTGECSVRNRKWAESGLGLICIVVLVSLFFNTRETGQGRSHQLLIFCSRWSLI